MDARIIHREKPDSYQPEIPDSNPRDRAGMLPRASADAEAVRKEHRVPARPGGQIKQVIAAINTDKPVRLKPQPMM
jgi:hypothetical protein